MRATHTSGNCQPAGSVLHELAQDLVDRRALAPEQLVHAVEAVELLRPLLQVVEDPVERLVGRAHRQATPRRERPSTRRTRGARVRTCRTWSVRATSSWLRQPVPVYRPRGVERHRVIEDREAREVVEEVRALARLGVHLRQRRLHDPARPRDLVPAHRDAEPGIGRCPSGRSRSAGTGDRPRAGRD